MKYLFLFIFSCNLYAQVSLMDMFKEGDYYGVIEYSDQISAPNSSTSFIIAKSHMALGDNKKAIHYFHRSTSKYPEAYYFLGQCYYAEGKWDLSFKSFKKSADLKVKKEISYLYLAKVLNEKNLVNESVQLLNKLIKNKTTSKDVRQSAEYLKANIYLTAFKRSRNSSTSFLKRKVLRSFEQAYQLNKTSSFAPEISNDIQSLKSKYYVGLTNFFVNAEQTVEYNSNVLNQATEVPLEQETATPLHATNVSGRIDYGIPYNFPIKSQNSFYMNWTKYIEEANEVAQLNNITIGFNSQNNFNPFVHSSNIPLLLRVSGNYALTNNELQGNYNYDNFLTTFGAGLNYTNEVVSTDYYLSYTNNASYQSANEFSSINLSGFSTFSVSPQTTISLMNNLAFINFSETATLSTIELQNTFNYIYQIKDGHSIYTGGRLNLILPKETESMDARGVEILLSPTFTYEWRPTQRLYTSLAYTLTKKFSKDKTSFDYTQHLAQFRLGFYYD